jgi:hypothetical protein
MCPTLEPSAAVLTCKAIFNIRECQELTASQIYAASDFLAMLYGAIMRLRFHYENLAKHRVTPEEAEECFFDPNRLRKRIGDIYWLIAKTEAGRILHFGYIKEAGDSYFVFHGMPARQYEKRQYKTRGK